MSRQVIRDIVTVPEHPTVVRLDSIGAEGSEWIERSYCLTEDVKGHLKALSSAFSMGAGKGIFLIGAYGSGKTHLLAWLITRLNAGDFLPEGPSVEFISLVNFSSRMRLEDIVHASLGIQETSGDRRTTWASVSSRYERGLVLVLDELSEFLRSKSDPGSFNEDIRFLQFLGEWATSHRLWIIGALQEGIERTGAIEHDLYRKIKDRYPLRLILSPTHIRDLIADGVLSKLEGYDEAVRKVMDRLRQASPPGADWDMGALASIYPIHPATLDLLEEVRDRFSQARGAIDFTVTQLRGDPQRGIPPFLDRPVGELVTPDAIIDHYSDLMAIQPEFLPISDKVFPYYEKNMARLVEKEPLRAVTWRLLKLLALVLLSRSRKGITAKEAVYWLGFSAVSVAPEKNLKIVADALERLAAEGQFVRSSRGVYSLQTEDDTDGAVQRLLGQEIQRMGEAEETLFEELVPLLPDKGVNPLLLPRGAWLPRDVKWHGHDRRCHAYIDNDEPAMVKESKANTLCIRLPWGDAGPSQSHHTLVPSRLSVDDDVREAVACARLLKKTVDVAVEKRVRRILDDRLLSLANEITSAFCRGRRLAPGAHGETVSGTTAHDTTEAWLADGFRWVLGRNYSAFQRFAPASGPVPLESYRAFFRFLEGGDIERSSDDPGVDLIREAYMVPMKLLKGAGREYRLSRDIERNELIRLVSPLFENDPAPAPLYEYLASSLYGLVPDQIHVLLIFLYSQGEIDIIKGKRSISDLYETFPTPDKYDSIIKGGGLDSDAAKALELLCSALGVRAPSQGTVVSQRQAATRASAQVAADSAPLSLLSMQLADVGGAGALRERIARFLDWTAALTRSDDSLVGLRQLLYEAGSVERYLDERSVLRNLPERIQRLIVERDRLAHLLSGIPATALSDPDTAVALESLEAPPGLDAIESLQNWITTASAFYERYKKTYIAAHDRHMEEISSHPAWRFELSGLATLRHVGLKEALSNLKSLAMEAERRRCKGISNLSFSPLCSCGFDGERGGVDALLDRLLETQKEIEDGLAAFFAKREVVDKVRSFAKERANLHPGISSYLARQSKLPVIEDLDAFERHLAGLDTVRTISIAKLGRTLAARSWTRGRLHEALDEFLGSDRGEMVRFEGPTDDSFADKVASWCVARSLETGAPLPEGLPEKAVNEAVYAADPAGISESALAGIESLGFPEPSVDRVLGLFVEGALLVRPSNKTGPLLSSVLDMTGDVEPDSIEVYAERIAAYYASSDRLCRLAPEPWTDWLDRLASWSGLSALRDGIELLRANDDADWLIVDALGAPLASAVASIIEDILPSWRLEKLEYGRLKAKSTTSGFYGALADAGVKHPFSKIDCIDRIVHERRAPFAEWTKLALAELSIAVREYLPRLDRGRPLVVTADHGFRLSRDARELVHGGSSLLESTIPLFRLAPR